ncbi:alpha/beta fold hydrolase [Natrarchaeobaculum aegyptiacum]|uniref:Alpha/beta hydrolase n=1 Tax=Natrarchaeobaculum aegyptiacum TaxID=745377 RepID=A0A2Z2HNW8_9EURY|nr:alpha/beta hydrolase [Natrarchaeobaculum aegyptiacum]ARS88631.1 alpha/beta hydrolase [Natrarchaeobaculum aegyptiacum]
MATLSLEDGRLWYEETGEGRPLVFVHGGWMNGRSWEPQVERFADEYRVVTLDVRGHGRTGATDTDRYSIDLFTDDLEALLEHLELEDPILGGLSLGSMVVQEYLHRHPSRASAAVLAGAIRSMPPVDLPQGIKPLLSPTPALTSSLAMTGPTATFQSLLWSIRSVTGEPWLSVDPSVRATALEAVGDVSRTEFRKVFEALYRYEPSSLSAVETPTLVVHGDQEALPVRRQGDDLADEVAGGRQRTLANAGHLVNQDRPAAFNETTASFLERVGAT